MSSLDYLKELKVLLAVPNTGTWNHRMVMSTIAMITYFQTHKVGEYKRQAILPGDSYGSLLANKRVDMVKACLSLKCSHILFIDTDQTFPMTTLHRLVLHDLDVVGANIAVKKIPSSPTARGWPELGKSWMEAPLIYTDEGQLGLQKVARLGCGIMLVKRQVFEKVGLNCWPQNWIPEAEKYNGEDWGFCEVCEQHGIEIFIDHGLSNVVGHVGEFEFTHELVGEVQTPASEPANGKGASQRPSSIN